MTETELAWLAGFLEGEGSFIFHTKPNKGYITKQFIVQAVSVDEDVVRHAASLCAARVSGPYRYGAEHHQPYYRMMLARRYEVLNLLHSLRPLMGQRRRAQIDSMLQADLDHPRRTPGPKRKDPTHGAV